MRQVTPIESARFAKPGEPFGPVALPHTWNALDGQDGGADYFRGACAYEIDLPDPTPGLRQYVEFEAVNHIAAVSLNGVQLGEHRGGFSAFRFELTGAMKSEGNVLTVVADNDAPEVYPQKADFTFFGGIYRPVRFIEVPASHIDLMKDGSAGVFVTPDASGRTKVEVCVASPAGCEVRVELFAPDGGAAAAGRVSAEEKTALRLDVDKPVLWNGVAAPALYTAAVTLLKDGEALDEVRVRYGYRRYHVDADEGFFLNGVSCPLHGVCRHQDRENMGWAISDAHHREDMEIIREIGANTIRLAHYQHSQTFYDLCDEAGMVVWAEIPFISSQIPGEAARANTISQMRELILQNYNHPSICFWGIGNELTMGRVDEAALVSNLRELDALARQLDPTRLTTIAHLGMVRSDDPYTAITDVQSFNYYQGWYGGEIADNATILDAMHAALPGRAIGVSEYGADALITWHSATPRNHDYTEEYQAHYHAEVQKIFAARKYLWATHVWNMFDFAADARDEGGCRGRNNKGLVTYDRKIRKDAFYLYKAAWRQEPVLHICGRRFADRAPGERDVTVFSNCAAVTLRVNGEAVGTQAGDGYVFVFRDVPLKPGANAVVAEADGARDEIALNGVETRNPGYTIPPETIVAGNWFDEETGEQLSLQFPEGFFSIRDMLGDLMQNPEAAAVVAEVGPMLRPEGMAAPKPNGQGRPPMRMPGFMTLQQMIKRANRLSPVQIIRINQKLIKIPK